MLEKALRDDRLSVLNSLRIVESQRSENSTILKSLSRLQFKVPLWLIFLLAAALTFITEREEVLFFLAAGLLFMFIKAPPKGLTTKTAKSVVLLQIGFWDFEPGIFK